MLSQIDKIQKMVNSLLGLFDKAGPNEPLDQSSESVDKYESLGVMILKAQDGDLSDRAMLEMQRCLSKDIATLQYYLDFQNLTVLLQFHFNPSGLRKHPFRETSHSGAS